MANAEPKHMPILAHLAELRRRMMVAVIALLTAFICCYLYGDALFAILAHPLKEAFGADETRRMIFTGLPEAFLTKIKLAFFAAFLLSFPVLAAQVYLFIMPGLYKTEKKIVLPLVTAAPVLFYAGAALAYFYIFPLAWQFFVSFEHGSMDGLGLPLHLEARMSEYLSLIMHIMLAFGLSFQLPVLLILLARVGIVTPEGLAKSRRYAIVILLSIAAVLTPPDVLSQIGLFIPLYFLYEISIIGCRLVVRKPDGLIEPTLPSKA